MALAADDERAVGEVLVRQVEGADVVVVDDEPDSTAEVLLDHLTPARTMRLHELDVAALLEPRDREDVLHRGDPLSASASEAESREGVWTLQLESWRPFHPDRLRENLEALGGRPGRSRGVFWLPTRPDVVCQWEGAGGQLSLGNLSTWHDAGCEACTRLVVTGLDDEIDEVAAVFEATLLTDAELAAGLGAWAGRDDGYDPWLGSRRDVA